MNDETYEQKVKQEVTQYRERIRNININISMLWIIIAVVNILVGVYLDSMFSYLVAAAIIGGLTIFIIKTLFNKHNYAMEDLWMKAYFHTLNNYREALKCLGKLQKKNKPKLQKKIKRK